MTEKPISDPKADTKDSVSKTEQQKASGKGKLLKFHNITGKARFYYGTFIYILVINISIVLSTVVLHEAGHAIAGNYLGCSNIKIVIYDTLAASTFTQMSCQSDVPVESLALSGILLIIPYALFFVTLPRIPERYMSIVIIGFNFMLTVSDAMVLTNSPLLPTILVILGSVSVIVGEALFIDKALISYRKA